MPAHLLSCMWYVIIESNHSPTENAIAAEAFSRFAGTKLVFATGGGGKKTGGDGGSTKYGVATTNTTKENAVQILRSHIVGNSVYFDESFFGDRDLLLDQLSRMRRVLMPNSYNQNGTPVYQINGKVKSKFGRDKQVCFFFFLWGWNLYLLIL